MRRNVIGSTAGGSADKDFSGDAASLRPTKTSGEDDICRNPYGLHCNFSISGGVSAYFPG
jgi:hypothetical protein